MANSVDPVQSGLGTRCLLLYLIRQYLQQTTSAGDIFGCIFHDALRVKGLIQPKVLKFMNICYIV